MSAVKTILPALLLLCAAPVEAQDSALAAAAREHQRTMSASADGFSGPGWDFLRGRIEEARYVLVGEDHFTNEIPRFVEAVAGTVPVETFYIEVDPFSTEIIERSIRELGADERLDFRRKYGDLYSFYALGPEYELLEKLVSGGATLLGSDQVAMYADRLIFQDRVSRTSSEEAQAIYRHVAAESKRALDRFLQRPADPQYSEIYFMTPAFSEDLESLSSLNLSEEEASIVRAMQRSVDIYQTRSHRKRVQLIKHHLMADYPRWIGRRTLFKYGANHMARGESFLTVEDIGNLVANLAEARYEKSFHIMVVGESGMQGSPFRGFPPTEVDPDGFYLKHLQPFFPLTEGPEWAVFDLVPLRRALERGELAVDNQNLARSLKGFDALVLIPTVTAATLPAYD